MRLAKITKQLIEASINKDQGTAYRASLAKILPKIEDAYRPSDSGFRSHLGASLIGRSCSFELWLGFRWVQKSDFPERILRLFNRGHLEEAHFIAMLESAKIKCWYETEEGGQFRLSDHGGHFGSALDGVVKVPELEGVPAYGEFKTHNDKSFTKLIKEGVQTSKYEHYVQMQICMDKMNLKYAVYFAVNKNDDHLHIEIIEYSHEIAKRYLKRAGNIIFGHNALPRISNKASWYECKFCSKKEICHGTKVPEVNCRTCVYSRTIADGTWECSKFSVFRPLYKNKQLLGCPHHVFNPHLMPSVKALKHNVKDNYMVLRLQDGNIIKQGPKHVQSKDLKLC